MDELAGGLLARLQDRMRENGTDRLLVTEPDNLTYLTGIEEINGYLVVEQEDWRFVTSGFFRYAVDALANVSFFDEREDRGDVLADAGVGDGVAADDPDAVDGVALEASSLVENCRRTKLAGEVERMRRACGIGDGAMASAREAVAPGVPEMQVVKAFDAFFRGNGVYNAFETLAHVNTLEPHRRSDGREFAAGDLMLVDCGCRYRNYCSDMTRLMPSGWNDERRAVAEAVKRAHGRCLGMVEPGVAVAELASAAIDVVEDAGFDREKHYLHSLGHGVGVSVHEGPTLHTSSDAELEEGMVVTVEPGLYVPDIGGARVEDQIVVTAGGCEKLTGAPYVDEY